VAAPIGTIPLFVSAGSIIPLGSDIQNTSASQALKEIRVYPGRESDFTLYDDDGVSYDYEKGQGRVTHLHWDDERGQLTGKGAPLGTSIAELTKVVR
jgi:alpha-D-xyloside xylohydrolase